VATGAELEPAAEHIRKLGHTVHCPTLAGNRPGDDRSRTGLMDAARSLEAFLKDKNLSGVRLVGHNYGGMVITN
jgi:pimeloyl-ACP methyl ester carboxylesterase